MADWQTIDTAPLDKTSVLVAKAGDGGDKKPLRAYFYDGKWWPHLRGPFSKDPMPLEGVYAPTHWQHLPEPPK